MQSPEKVIKQIKQCKYIASSSLHGLIIADAYHIPNIRIVDYDTFAYPACNYKFEDYYSALGLEDNFVMRGNERKDQLIALATVKPVEKIEKIQKALDEVMRQFAHIIKQRQR